MNIYLTPEKIKAVALKECDVIIDVSDIDEAIATKSADNAVRVILDEIENPFAYPESEEDSQRYLGFETFRDVLKKLTKTE